MAKSTSERSQIKQGKAHFAQFVCCYQYLGLAYPSTTGLRESSGSQLLHVVAEVPDMLFCRFLHVYASWNPGFFRTPSFTKGSLVSVACSCFDLAAADAVLAIQVFLVCKFRATFLLPAPQAAACVLGPGVPHSSRIPWYSPEEAKLNPLKTQASSIFPSSSTSVSSSSSNKVNHTPTLDFQGSLSRSNNVNSLPMDRESSARMLKLLKSSKPSTRVTRPLHKHGSANALRRVRKH